MTDQITVNVDDLWTAVDALTSTTDWTQVRKNLRAALVAHDKAEQERNGRMVFVAKCDDEQFEDEDLISQFSASMAGFWYVREEALGEFYPHQEHAYQGNSDSFCGVACTSLEGVTYYCTSPEWAHTTPAVPDWQTDETVLVVEDKHGERWVRSNAEADRWWPVGGEFAESWSEVLEEGAPIRPVGWRRDPDSIVIPKSSLDGLTTDEWRNEADKDQQRYGDKATIAPLFNAIADALEADQ